MKTRRSLAPACRAGLTLLELVVVLAILVVLSGLIVPLIAGLGNQTNASTNAAVVGDINHWVGVYYTRFEKYPNRWDSLLNSSDGFYTKLHANLTTTVDGAPPILSMITIDAVQAQSLKDAGIFQLHDSDETGTLPPSESGATVRTVADGAKLVCLNKTLVSSSSPGSTFLGGAFNITELQSNIWVNEYVVVGLGNASTIRGAVMTDVPLMQSSDPSLFYSRMLCVFMIPPAASSSPFPAKFVGSFLPDGSSLRTNLDRYHQNSPGN
jgi:prepilin-type N-terminal cleavage/methylation domain-containing protein